MKGPPASFMALGVPRGHSRAHAESTRETHPNAGSRVLQLSPSGQQHPVNTWEALNPLSDMLATTYHLAKLNLHLVAVPWRVPSSPSSISDSISAWITSPNPAIAAALPAVPLPENKDTIATPAAHTMIQGGWGTKNRFFSC